ncbi:MAG: RloB domain-containing protein [Bacteroidales bacterium]|nr:RloB domain-containing protein [Bacteroidales bacterium]
MITRVRQYGKKEPSRDAHKIYVVCEGSSDEPAYFGFFEGLSSNLNVIPIPSEKGNTDPVKLAEMATSCFDKNTGRYRLDYSQGDRVWFVIDTDTWEDEGKIAVLREYCKSKNTEVRRVVTKSYQAWNVAQSKPSFEIWLYYHFYSEAPVAEEAENAVSFKKFVNDKITGGFNYEKDPVNLKVAIANAKANYAVDETGALSPYVTEVFLLGREIYGFVAGELAKLYNKLR